MLFKVTVVKKYVFYIRFKSFSGNEIGNNIIRYELV